MAAKIQWRRDTAANWALANPILAEGEAGAELDTNPLKFKLGDGVTQWNSLPYEASGVPTITLTGDVTGSGAGTIATTIAGHAVTNTKLAQMAASTLKGNVTGVLADAADLTGTQVTTLLDTFSNTLKGLVPPSGGGTTFLRADGTWVSPSGAGTVTSIDVSGGTTGIITTGGPVTGAGVITLAFANQAQNLALASPDGSSGIPVFRALNTNDITGLPRNLTAQWLTADGTTKTINHNWNTRRIRVEVIDNGNSYATIYMDSITRPTQNNVVLVGSEVPSSAWTVLLTEVTN